MATPPIGAEMVAVVYHPVGLQIEACPYCSRWWAECVHTGTMLVLCEWHEPTCPTYTDWRVPVLVREFLTLARSISRAPGRCIRLPCIEATTSDRQRFEGCKSG